MNCLFYCEVRVRGILQSNRQRCSSYKNVGEKTKVHCVSNHFRCPSSKRDRGKLAKQITDGARHIKNAQHIKKDNDELPLAIVIGARH